MQTNCKETLKMSKIEQLQKIINKQEQKINELVSENKQVKEIRKLIHKNTGLKLDGSQSAYDCVSILCNYYEGLIAKIPEHVYWKDKNGIYLGCNDGQAKDLEFSSGKEIVGKTDFDLPWAKQAAALQRVDKKVMETGKEHVAEEPVDLPDGTRAIFLSRKVPLHDEKQRAIGTLGVSVDITKRKLMEKKLAQEKIKAEVANKLKTEFIRNMEHDLRTPAAGVSLLLDTMLSKEKNPQKKELLTIVSQSSKQLLCVLNNILDFDRIEQGTFPVLEKKFNIEELINNIVELESPAAKIKNLKLIPSYSKDLPGFILADDFRITRILLNLISNAIKFTKKGDIFISVNLEEFINEKKVILKILIEDTGIGIPEEGQNIIYEKFVKLNPSNEGIYQGQGLGLKIVNQFIRELDGEIELESEIDKGSTFTCLIPVKLPILDKSLATLKKHANTKEKPKKTNIKRILLVEDNYIAQVGTMIFLKELKMEVDIASTGAEAIELANKNRYDLILMDLGLSDIDGFEVTKTIRNSENINKNTIIVALTAHSDDDVIEKGKAAGMDDVLTKPLNIEKLEKFDV